MLWPVLINDDNRRHASFICLSHDGVTFNVDCDVSTAVLQVFIR